MRLETKTDTPVIEASAIRHQYGRREVLNLERLRVMPGENQLLLGPSGCGKTTLISILTGLLKPSSGHVSVMGQTLGPLSASALDILRTQTFGLVFQDHHLISSLSVEDNLFLALHFADQKQDKFWIHKLLALLDLEHLRHSKPSSLSRGEAQRAAVARAAVCKPPIIVADEPTSALDDTNTENVVSLFTSLVNEWGAALVVASHDNRIKHHFDQQVLLTPGVGVAA